MKVLHVCSKKAVPMLNIIKLYQRELKKHGIRCDANTTGEVKGNYDVIHGHYSLTKPVIKACLRARTQGIPFIIHHHGSDVRRITEHGPKRLPPHHNLIGAMIRRGADVTLLSTPDLHEWVEGLYLANPVDLQRFRPMEREKNGRVLIFGSFVSKKALLPLLKDDEEYDMLNWGVDMDMPNNVRKIPFRPNKKLPELFNRYEKMIGPLVDPVSLGRLEAMACGLDTYTNFPKKYEVYYGFENPDHAKEPRKFVEKYHSPSKIIDVLLSIYHDISRR